MISQVTQRNPALDSDLNSNPYLGQISGQSSGRNWSHHSVQHVGQTVTQTTMTPANNITAANASADHLRTLTTTADNLLSRPDLADRFIPRQVAIPTTAEMLVTQQTPLDLLRVSGPPNYPISGTAAGVLDIDQTSGNTLAVRQGDSIKQPHERLPELSYIPGAAVAPATLRNVTTLAGQSDSFEASRVASNVHSQPVSSSAVNHKVVQLTLEKDSGLAGSRNQMRYYLSTSGQQPGQPLEPSQPPVKSPVGSMSNGQTGLEIRSLQMEKPKLAELTIGPEIDAGMQSLNALDGAQRDRINTLASPTAGIPKVGNQPSNQGSFD